MSNENFKLEMENINHETKVQENCSNASENKIGLITGIKVFKCSDFPEEPFYTKAREYWSKIPATVNGMLGGFGDISNLDILGSKIFLEELFAEHPSNEKKYALDCGAGIGRVSKYLLTPLFEKVDLIEQNPNFCAKAIEYIGENSEKVGKIHNCALQKFKTEEKKYDVVWIQWVSGHLEDTDFIDFLMRMRSGLKKGGIVVLKENVTSSGRLERDSVDSSFTRPLSEFRKRIKQANYKILKSVKQANFPKGLYPVYMIAAQPDPNSHK